MNTGGPASEKTLLDEFAGQALVGFFGYITEVQTARKDAGLPGIKREQVSRECYEQAESMLAEKARREADHSEDTLAKVDHSPDATKMIELQDAKRELLSALEIIHATLSASGTDLTGRSVHTLVGIASTVITKHKGAK